MQDHSTRTARTRRSVVVLALLSTAVVAAACSRDQGARPPLVTTQSDPTTTTTTTEAPLSPNQQGTTSTTVDQSAPIKLKWVRQVGGLGGDDIAGVTGRNNTVIAVGSTDGATGPTSGGRDAMVAIVDTDGALSNLQQAGGAGSDRASGVSYGGEYALACGITEGGFSSAGSFSPDGWCTQIDENAQFGEIAPFGSDADDAVSAVALPSPPEDNNSPQPDASQPDASQPDAPQDGYIVGSTTGILPGAEDPSGRGLGDGDSVVARVDSFGEAVWVRQFGSFGTDRASAVTTTEDADAVVVGTTSGDSAGRSQGGLDSWMARFDRTGNQRWSIQLGTSGEDRLAAAGVSGQARRGDERFLAAGSTTGKLGDTANGGDDAVALALGSDGRRQWTTQWGSTGNERATAMVADGGTLFIAGSSDGPLGTLRTDLGPGGARDGFITAIDTATGKIQWTSRFGSAGNDEVSSLAVTEDGLLVVGGATSGQLTGAKSAGGTDGFLVAFELPGGGGGAASSV